MSTWILQSIIVVGPGQTMFLLGYQFFERVYQLGETFRVRFGLDFMADGVHQLASLLGAFT